MVQMQSRGGGAHQHTVAQRTPMPMKSTQITDTTVSSELAKLLPNLQTVRCRVRPCVRRCQCFQLPSLAASVARVWCAEQGQSRGEPHAMQYASDATVSKKHVTTKKAGSSRAHWFFVCL